MEFEFLLDQAISSVFTRHRQSDLGKKSKDRFKGIHNMCHSQKKKKIFFFTMGHLKWFHEEIFGFLHWIITTSFQDKREKGWKYNFSIKWKWMQIKELNS